MVPVILCCFAPVSTGICALPGAAGEVIEG